LFIEFALENKEEDHTTVLTFTDVVKYNMYYTCNRKQAGVSNIMGLFEL
jgi:hypothetical protein